MQPSINAEAPIKNVSIGNHSIVMSEFLTATLPGRKARAFCQICSSRGIFATLFQPKQKNSISTQPGFLAICFVFATLAPLIIISQLSRCHWLEDYDLVLLTLMKDFFGSSSKSSIRKSLSHIFTFSGTHHSHFLLFVALITEYFAT
jgi:hypothetical protein